MAGEGDAERGGAVAGDAPSDALERRIGREARECLRAARIGVAGAGGLGSNIAVMLARSGVGELVVADFDAVDEGNLNRQHYFRSDLGRPKVEALAEQIRAIGAGTRVRALRTRVTAENVRGIFGGCDIVCEAFDDPEAKALLVERLLTVPDGPTLVSGNGMAGLGPAAEGGGRHPAGGQAPLPLRRRDVGRGRRRGALLAARRALRRPAGPSRREDRPGARGLVTSPVIWQPSALRADLSCGDQRPRRPSTKGNTMTEHITSDAVAPTADTWTLGGREFTSRFILGSGKFRLDVVKAAVEDAGAQIVTLAVRRANTNQEGSILDAVPEGVTLLPNTSGARTAEEAVRIARLARELGCGDFIKVEVIRDARYLLPDNAETVRATDMLASEGFTVLPYMYPDLNVARDLVSAGAAAVMPLGAPIGSNRGLVTRDFIRILIEEIELPVIVDAGIGRPSQACEAMEMGAAAVMANTAVATAGNIPLMARAFGEAVRAGRAAFLAGPGRVLDGAGEASSPLTGFLGEEAR